MGNRISLSFWALKEYGYMIASEEATEYHSLINHRPPIAKWTVSVKMQDRD